MTEAGDLNRKSFPGYELPPRGGLEMMEDYELDRWPALRERLCSDGFSFPEYHIRSSHLRRIHRATLCGRLKKVDYLLIRGSDINERDKEKR